MDDKKTLKILGGVMLGTLLLIVGFAAFASRPSKPVVIETKNAFYLGAKNAKVTVVVFSDFSCPSCAAFALNVFPQLFKEFKDQVRFVYKFFPLYEIHPAANIAAQSAYCAGKLVSATDSGMINAGFFQYGDLLMEKQQEWATDTAKLIDYAVKMEKNKDDFLKCQNSDEAKTAVLNDRAEGERLGVNSTPTFYLNGEKMVGTQSIDVWRKALNAKLEAGK